MFLPTICVSFPSFHFCILQQKTCLLIGRVMRNIVNKTRMRFTPAIIVHIPCIDALDELHSAHSLHFHNFFFVCYCGFSWHFAVCNFFIAWKRCNFTNLVSLNRGKKTLLRQAEVVNQRKLTKRKCIIAKCTHQKRNDYVISHSAEEKLICVICIYVFFFRRRRRKLHANRMQFFCPLRGGTEQSHGSKRESKIIYRSKSWEWKLIMIITRNEIMQKNETFEK